MISVIDAQENVMLRHRILGGLCTFSNYSLTICARKLFHLTLETMVQLIVAYSIYKLKRHYLVVYKCFGLI